MTPRLCATSRRIIAGSVWISTLVAATQPPVGCIGAPVARMPGMGIADGGAGELLENAMSLLLILLAVFFGLILWCTAPRLVQMLRRAAVARRASSLPARLAIRVRIAGD